MLQLEHEQRLRLEEMVEQLAKQHSSLEKQARKSLAHLPATPSVAASRNDATSPNADDAANKREQSWFQFRFHPLSGFSFVFIYWSVFVQ